MIVIVFLMALAVAKPPDPPPYIGGKPVPQADRLRPADGDRLDPGLFDDPFPEIREPREIAPGQGIKPIGSVGSGPGRWLADWWEAVLVCFAALGTAAAKYRKRIAEWWHPVKRGEFVLLTSKVEELEEMVENLRKIIRDLAPAHLEQAQNQHLQQLKTAGEEQIRNVDAAGRAQLAQIQQAQTTLRQGLDAAEKRFEKLVHHEY